MTTTRQALRALCISSVGLFAVAGTAAASTLRPSIDRFAATPVGMIVDPATHVYTIAGPVHHTAMRPLHSWMSARAKGGKKLVYVSDVIGNYINIYPADVNNPAPVGSITGLGAPDGLALDAAGNLYVALAMGGGVEVFPPGSTTPSFKYSNIEDPVSVVVDSNNVVYIGIGDNGGDHVVEFNVGSNTPLRTISYSALGGGAPYGLKIDANDNLFVSTGLGAVYEYAPGATTGTNLNLLGMQSGRCLALDSKNDIFATGFELGGGNFVNEYLAGQTSVDRQFTVGDQPFELAFGKKDKDLYVAQVGYGTQDGSVQAYANKSGGLDMTIRDGIERPIGVALTPDVK